MFFLCQEEYSGKEQISNNSGRSALLHALCWWLRWAAFSVLPGAVFAAVSRVFPSARVTSPSALVCLGDYSVPVPTQQNGVLAFAHLLHAAFSFQKLLSDAEIQMQLPAHKHLENKFFQIPSLHVADFRGKWCWQSKAQDGVSRPSGNDFMRESVSDRSQVPALLVLSSAPMLPPSESRFGSVGVRGCCGWWLRTSRSSRSLVLWPKAFVLSSCVLITGVSKDGSCCWRRAAIACSLLITCRLLRYLFSLFVKWCSWNTEFSVLLWAACLVAQRDKARWCPALLWLQLTSHGTRITGAARNGSLRGSCRLGAGPGGAQLGG